LTRLGVTATLRLPLQGLFWPAFMVYEVFKALGRRG
jgi:hypothetical protein